MSVMREHATRQTLHANNILYSSFHRRKLLPNQRQEKTPTHTHGTPSNPTEVAAFFPRETNAQLAVALRGRALERAGSLHREGITSASPIVLGDWKTCSRWCKVGPALGCLHFPIKYSYMVVIYWKICLAQPGMLDKKLARTCCAYWYLFFAERFCSRYVVGHFY